MIYNSTHLTELQSPVQKINSRVELYSGSTLVTVCNCHDTLRDFSITRAGSENKYFGFGICQKAQIHLIDLDRAIAIDKSNTVKVAFGAQEEFIYTVPTFHIDDIKRDEVSNDITLVTYDVLYGAANHQVSELNLKAPYTVEDVARACAAFLGVGFKHNVNDASFATDYPTGANLDGTETIRQLLDAIAEVTQTIYYIDQTDALVFKRLDAHGASVLTIGKRDYYELKAHDAHTLAAIAHATELGENLEATYSGGIVGVGATQYIRDNPFWELLEPSVVATKLQGAIAAMGGIVAHPYECTWTGNYLLEIGDKISFIGEDDSIITSYLLDDALDYSGIFEEESNWLFKENEAETPSNPVTIGEKLNQTFARVDKIEREIKLYVGEVVNESVDELINGAIAESMGAIQEDIKDLQANDTATDQLLQQLETDMGELEKQGAATDQKVAQLTLTTDGINASVESLSTEQATIKNNLNTVTGEQTSIKSDIAALKVKDNEIAADISSLEQSHTTLNTKVTGIEGEVSTVKTEQSTLKQQQATLTTNLEGITGRVSDIEEKSTEIEDEVAGIKAAHSETSNKVATLETNLNGITGRVSSIESTNTSQANEISGIKSTQSTQSTKLAEMETTLEGFGTRVSNVETKNSQISNEITGIKNSQTTTTNQLTELIGDFESISGRVSATEQQQSSMSDEINGIKETQEATDEKVADLELDLNGFSTRVSNVESKNASQDNEISGVKSTQSAQATKIATMETNLSGFTTRVSNVENKNSTLENEISGVKETQNEQAEQITEIKGDFSSITTRVKSVEEKNTSQDNEITGVKSTQSTHSTKLGELTTSLDGISGRVSSVEATTSTLANEVAGVKSTQSTQSSKISSLELTTSGFDTRISNTETTVQEVAANQEGLTESITSTEERVANLEITADGINSSVSTLQKNIEETNGQIEAQTAQLRTEIQQSSESVQIEIQNIKEEGAHKVVTNTGYTFDDDGLTVSKSTSGISTQITHDGMTVSEYNNELLSADSHGVSAKDLHARTYLIIGGNSRFEDYNSNRTACFWVGN